MKLVQRHIKPEEMVHATEVFLAGTAAEVTPVRQIGELSFTPGRITETLFNDYNRLVHYSPAEVARITG
jgi:branched-chain amino acid aminotransferase